MASPLTFEIALKRHAEMPEDGRPTFVVRYCSDARARELNRRMDEVDALGKDVLGLEVAARRDVVVAEILELLAGWRHMPDVETGQEVAFDLKDIGRCIYEFERYELAGRILCGQGLSPDQAKKCLWASRSAAGPSSDAVGVKDRGPGSGVRGPGSTDQTAASAS